MTPRDLDPDARRTAALEVARRSPGCNRAEYARCVDHNGRCHCRADSDAAITAYLNALGLVMVPKLKTGVPGKGEA